MSNVKKVLITVKTYPSISKKYDELVCTAGILEDGSWIRIYPLPFRKLDYETRYKKSQWLEVPLEKNPADIRPESYRVSDIKKMRLLHVVDTKNDWRERRKLILKNSRVFENLKTLIEKANNNELSLAIFKPSKIIDFKCEACSREWSKEKMELLKSKSQQLSIFQTPEEVEKEFTVVPKLPFRFSYTFADDAGQESTLMIEDWEVGMLYWNCLKDCDGNEENAIAKVRQKYLVEFSKKDLHLFLGTTKRYHGWAKNPFVIIGVFYPPIKEQTSLF
jgi:hypothetical protein